MNVTVNLVTAISQLEAIAGEWRQLHAETNPKTPFSTPEWNLLWWHHMRASSPLVRDELYSFVARDDAGQLLAVAPMMITLRPAYGPLRYRELQCFGADPFITEIRGIACRPAHELQCMNAILEAIGREQHAWDTVKMSGLSERVYMSNTSRDELQRLSELSSYYVDLPTSWDELKTCFSRNAKEDLRRCYNSLKRDGLECSLRVITGADDIHGGLNRLFRLHQARSQMTNGVHHRDVFASANVRRLISDFFGHAASGVTPCIFELLVQDNVVASRAAFIFPEELFLYYSGYDPAWAKYKVMTTLTAEIMKWSIEQGLSTVGLSTGADQSKLRWRPEARVYITARSIAANMRSRAYTHAYNFLAHDITHSLFPKNLVRRLRRAKN